MTTATKRRPYWGHHGDELRRGDYVILPGSPRRVLYKGVDIGSADTLRAAKALAAEHERSQ